MPKPRRAGRAPEGRSVDQELSDLGRLATADRGHQRDAVPRGSPLEDDAEREDRRSDADREAYERVAGKRPSGRKQMQQRDERRPGLELDKEDDEELEEDEEPINARGEEGEEPDDAADVDEDAEDDGASRVSQKQLDKARQALRRAKAPSWVYDEDPERILELAESFAGHQSNADRVIAAKDETIRALAAGRNGGTRASAESESDRAEIPPDDDLDSAAEGLARAMGLDADDATKKALKDYGRSVRKAGASPRDANASREVERLQGIVRNMVLDQGVRGLRRLYPEFLSDANEVAKLKKRAVMLSADESFENDVPGLFKEAARGLWGEPRRASSSGGPARPRKGTATVTSSRRDERRGRPPAEGTEEHDRAVYRQIQRKNRSRIAVRR